jgi:hypothetical protein
MTARLPDFARRGRRDHCIVPPRFFVIPVLAAAAFLAGCTAQRGSEPLRTATEQLLISSAADRAAAQLVLAIPKDTRVFVDRQYFQGYDDGYAVNAIRAQLLRQGLALVDDRTKADAIVTVASGALSTDEKSLLIGIPQLTLPFLPIGNSVTVPEIALFKNAQDKATAKFVATGYDAKTGKLIATTDPQYGFSHQTNHTIMLFFSWQTGDLIPPGIDQNQLSVTSIANSIPDELGLIRNTNKPKPP